MSFPNDPRDAVRAVPARPAVEPPGEGTTASRTTQLRARAARGVKLMVARQFAILALSFASAVALARILDPIDFGVFAIATYFVETLGVLATWAFSQALIQRRTVAESELRIALTIELALVALIVGVLFVAAPEIESIYPDAPAGTATLIRLVAVGLLLVPLRSLSALQLERDLSYDRLAWIEVIETATFSGVAVALAAAGLGMWSFAFAYLARGALGALLVFVARPWRLGFSGDRVLARGLVRDVLPFEAQGFLEMSSGWVVPVLVGTLAGPQAVGFVVWAAAIGCKPLMFVRSIVRVAFAHLSRTQDDRRETEWLLLRYAGFLLSFTGLWLSTIAIAGDALVALLFGAKWNPAVTALIVFSGALVLDTIWLLTVNALNATGRARRTTVALAGFHALYLALAIPLVAAYGFSAAPISYALALAGALPLVLAPLGRRSVLRLARDLAWLVLPVLAALAAGGAARSLAISGPAEAALLTVVTVGAYASVLLVVSPEWFRDGIRGLLRRPVSAPTTAAFDARAVRETETAST